MNLTGLHFMLTWQCILECDHCFVWGSPQKRATWSLVSLRAVLDQALALGGIESIYFEGGEPFLYYPLLVSAVQEARARGFRVGIVTNGYWATGYEEAINWLRPLAGLVAEISMSSDRYHWDAPLDSRVEMAVKAARNLEIPWDLIRIALPEELAASNVPPEASTLMFRGRAAQKLSDRVPHQPAASFTRCPFEDLQNPGRVHIDPYGNVHICQGIMIGNTLETPLYDLVARYDAAAHPIIGPLLRGGPVELARSYGVVMDGSYADACHLCYTTRRFLQADYPQLLGPVEMYGELNSLS